jgi:hypothetical protein
VIGRVLRAQLRSFAGDVVLFGVAAAGFVMSLSLATSIPPEFAKAPADVREALVASFSVALAAYAAVLATVYGSFRYTIDRRDGVVAQRLMSQPRWALLLVRVPSSALGGAVVGLSAILGGHAALVVAMGGMPMDGAIVLSTATLGAVAALWGMGVGVIVQTHLVALFVASLSLGATMLVAMFWDAGAVYFPLFAMLAVFGFDITTAGVLPGHVLAPSVAVVVTVGWVLGALVAAAAAFLTRDVA